MNYYFLQATADISTNLPCPKDTSDIVYLISSFLMGGTLSTLINNFYNVKNTEQFLKLDAEIKLAKQREENLIKEIAERDNLIIKLTKEIGELREQQTSGFTTRMCDLENNVKILADESKRLKTELSQSEDKRRRLVAELKKYIK